MGWIHAEENFPHVIVSDGKPFEFPSIEEQRRSTAAVNAPGIAYRQKMEEAVKVLPVENAEMDESGYAYLYDADWRREGIHGWVCGISPLDEGRQQGWFFYEDTWVEVYRNIPESQYKSESWYPKDILLNTKKEIIVIGKEQYLFPIIDRRGNKGVALVNGQRFPVKKGREVLTWELED